jgi:hypothetical protein
MVTMKTLASVLVPLALLVASAAGCGRPFDIKTAPGLVELQDQEPAYSYRAITPEGVAVAVKVVDLEENQGDLAFWQRATALRMHQLNGYALLGEGDVKARNGVPGHEMRFGHDESSKPYVYTLRVFLTRKGWPSKGSRLFLVESGGPREEVTRYQRALDWMTANLEVD